VTTSAQSPQERQTVHAGQLVVQDQTAAIQGAFVVKKRLGAGVRTNVEPLNSNANFSDPSTSGSSSTTMTIGGATRSARPMTNSSAKIAQESQLGAVRRALLLIGVNRDQGRDSATIAIRTSSDRLAARILVIRLAR